MPVQDRKYNESAYRWRYPINALGHGLFDYLAYGYCLRKIKEEGVGEKGNKVYLYHKCPYLRKPFALSPDESQGYYAFLAMQPSLPPLHRFLVCNLHLRFLVQSFSNLGQMSLVPRSIDFEHSAIPFVTTMGSKRVFLVCTLQTWVFNQFPSHWHQKKCWTKV